MKWLQINSVLESGPSFTAPFGTRVGALVDPGSSSSSSNVNTITDDERGVLDLTGDNEAGDQGTGNIVEDMSWRFDISVGTLIDAKDRQNVWYQVGCAIIDCKV